MILRTGGLAGLLGMRWKSSEAAAGILVGGCELNMVAPSMFTTNTTIGRMVQGESPRSAIPTLEMMIVLRVPQSLEHHCSDRTTLDGYRRRRRQIYDTEYAPSLNARVRRKTCDGQAFIFSS